MASEYFAPVGTGALTGAGTGAAIGSVVPGVGTAVGAGLGAVIGGLGGYFTAKGNKAASGALAQSRVDLQALARSQHAQRMRDLQRTMSYFQPINDRLARLYGQGAVPQPQQFFTPPPLPPGRR